MEKALIKDLNSDFVDETVQISGIVERVIETSGPTIFHISDGTGTLSCTAFKKGERAYPEIKEQDAVITQITLEEFKGELEGKINNIKKLNESKKKQFQENMDKIQKEKAEVEEIPFLIQSEILEKLKPSMIKAAFQIRLAIFQNRPIIVRHHNDTDGYCSGYALERAILPLIEEEHKSEKAEWEFFSRSPSSAPYYELNDSIIDTSISLRNSAKYSNKMPLIIIADNGSSQEDLFSIQQAKAHGIDFVVIDHHYFEKDVISKEVLAHVNPHLLGIDGSKFSAGMICTELARLINPLKGLEQIPALAGLADRVDLHNSEDLNKYLKLAEQKGYSDKTLKDISLVIDFISSKVKFREAREYIAGIFGEPKKRQDQLISLMAPHIKNLDKKGLAISKQNAEIEKINNTTLQMISMDAFPGFGFYPKPGRCVSLLHEDLQNTKKIDNLVTLGYSETNITMRATDNANFSVHDLITFLEEKIPEAFIEGGGHKNAGAITFIPAKKQPILDLIREFIKKIQ